MSPQSRRGQNAILFQSESPRSSRGGRHPVSVGEWLSLVEHLVRDQGVGGSNPLSPTNYLNPIIELASLRVLQFRQLESTWVVEANPQLFALLYVRPKVSNASKRLG